jgi:hypothetical protein
MSLFKADASADQAEARIEYYLNEGWDGSGIKPYTQLLIAECALRTRRTARLKEHPDGPEDASELRSIVLEKARQRWLSGLYADPFTRNPRKRPCL